MSQTRTVVLSMFIILGIYDAYVCTAGNTDISISQFIINMCNVSPVAYGVVCVLIGHFGFAMPPKFKNVK